MNGNVNGDMNFSNMNGMNQVNLNMVGNDSVNLEMNQLNGNVLNLSCSNSSGDVVESSNCNSTKKITNEKTNKRKRKREESNSGSKDISLVELSREDLLTITSIDLEARIASLTSQKI